MDRINKRIIIHLGLPKAASTFLQKQVLCNFENTAYIGPETIWHDPVFNQILYKPNTHYQSHDIVEYIHQIPEDTIIISCESLSLNRENPLNRQSVIKRLTHLFPAAHFLLFIRNQLDWMTSWYNHRISTAYNYKRVPPGKLFWFEEDEMAFKELNLFSKPSPGMILVFMLDYYECIKLYKIYTNNLHVFLYEDLKTGRSRILQHICSIVKQPYRKSSDYTPVNVSVSALTGQLLRLTNKISALNLRLSLHKKTNALIKRYTSGKPVQLPDEWQQKIRERFNENNRKIAEVFPDIGIQRHKDAYFLTDKN